MSASFHGIKASNIAERWEGMSEEALSAYCQLNVVLRDYQAQSVRWMLGEELAGHGVWGHFWIPLRSETGKFCYYSPFFEGFKMRESNRPVRGGWLCEEMGLGKTVEILALINGTRTLSPKAPTLAKGGGGPPTGQTLVVCPNSLIGQWEMELKKRSKRPLSVYRFHATRVEEPADLCRYDVVLTTYGTMGTEAGRGTKEYLAHQRRLMAIQTATKKQWELDKLRGMAKYEDATGTWRRNEQWYLAISRLLPDSRLKKEAFTGRKYVDALNRVQWRRVVFDEGHTLKNPGSAQSAQARTLQAQCKWLLTGTPMNLSVQDMEGQAKLFDVPGLDRRVWGQTNAKKAVAVPPRKKRFLANVVGRLMNRAMIRHTIAQPYGGREALLSLPPCTVSTVVVELPAPQAAIYAKLKAHAVARYQDFVARGMHTMRPIEVMALLMPLRQAASCSGQRLTLAAIDDAAAKSSDRHMARFAVKPAEDVAKAKQVAYGSIEDECTICLENFDEPLQTKCRHLFCSECVYSIINGPGNSNCPQCRAPLEAKELRKPNTGEVDASAGKFSLAAIQSSDSQSSHKADSDPTKEVGTTILHNQKHLYVRFLFGHQSLTLKT
jgi:hypothetical protein